MPSADWNAASARAQSRSRLDASALSQAARSLSAALPSLSASRACQRWSASTRGSISTRARACATVCSSTLTRELFGAMPARARASPMRSSVSGWVRRYGKPPKSLRRAELSIFSNIAAMPPGAKPAFVITWKPTRSASRSTSREKLRAPWIVAAWVPATTAFIASGLLLREAASRPRISAAMPTSVRFESPVMPRAMWRCVTCDISCASTDASSSREVVMAISPRCTPTKPPGSANALTLGSRTRNGCHAKRWSMSEVMLPSERDAATSGCQTDSRYSSRSGSST